MSQHLTCAACGGSGFQCLEETEACSRCGGTGRAYGYGEPCMASGGSGSITESRMANCGFRGGEGKTFVGDGSAPPAHPTRKGPAKRHGSPGKPKAPPEKVLASWLAIACGGAVGWSACTVLE